MFLFPPRWKGYNGTVCCAQAADRSCAAAGEGGWLSWLCWFVMGEAELLPSPALWAGIAAAPLTAFILQVCFVPRVEVCFLGSCFLLCSAEFCWGHWSAVLEETNGMCCMETDRQMYMLRAWSSAQGNMESRCWISDLLDKPWALASSCASAVWLGQSWS